MSKRNIEKRGDTWHLRWRVPKRYQRVEKRSEVSASLRTDSESEAVVLAAVAKSALKADWDARLAGRTDPLARTTYDELMGLARAKGITYRTTQDIADGPLEDIIKRLDAIATATPDSAMVPIALGGVDLPSRLVSEMPKELPRIFHDDISAKNPRQLREWSNKFKRATSVFIEKNEDKPVSEITLIDAMNYRDAWKDIRDDNGLTTQYTNKQIGYMRTLVAAYYKDLRVERFWNPFDGLAVEKTGRETRQPARRALELPVAWIANVLLDPVKTAGLNDEARDIAIISAECGTRASEIYDLPESCIHLNEPIPHVRIEIVEDGDERREIKNTASIRTIPLVGSALEAMKRHPTGFPRYRGKATYSATINKFFRDQKAFPTPKHTIKGLRHAFETRLRRAGVDNEERAQLMGHSLKKARGREVYGDETQLQIRALYAEMIAFPTENWKPRTHDEINTEIDRILEDEGFRRR